MSLTRQLGRLIVLGSAGCLLVLGAGCRDAGPAKYKVSGTLTWGGKPLDFDPIPGGVVELKLHQMKGDQRPKPDPEDTADDYFNPSPPGGMPGVRLGEELFSIATAAETNGVWIVDGVLSGKYLITVSYYPKGRFAAETGDPLKDALGGRFSTRNSDIIRVIDGNTTHMDIDLEKEQPAKHHHHKGHRRHKHH
jgi:hypothetical protein